MVMRGSAARRTLGNPLAGVLQDAHRKARRPTRTTGRPASPPPSEPVQEPVASHSHTRPASAPRGLIMAAVLETDTEGRAVWVFPRPLTAPPIIAAVPESTAPLLVTVEETSAERAVLRVWTARGRPAGAGTVLHTTATAHGGN